MTEELELTPEEATALKKRLSEEAEADRAKTWHTTVFEYPTLAVAFLNLNPVQGAGEASLASRPEAPGQVQAYYLL